MTANGLRGAPLFLVMAFSTSPARGANPAPTDDEVDRAVEEAEQLHREGNHRDAADRLREVSEGYWTSNVFRMLTAERLCEVREAVDEDSEERARVLAVTVSKNAELCSGRVQIESNRSTMFSEAHRLAWANDAECRYYQACGLDLVSGPANEISTAVANCKRAAERAMKQAGPRARWQHDSPYERAVWAAAACRRIEEGRGCPSPNPPSVARTETRTETKTGGAGTGSGGDEAQAQRPAQPDPPRPPPPAPPSEKKTQTLAAGGAAAARPGNTPPQQLAGQPPAFQFEPPPRPIAMTEPDRPLRLPDSQTSSRASLAAVDDPPIVNLRLLAGGDLCVRAFGPDHPYVGFCVEGAGALTSHRLGAMVRLVPEVYYRFEHLYLDIDQLARFVTSVHSAGLRLTFSFRASDFLHVEVAPGIAAAFLAGAGDLVYVGMAPGEALGGWSASPEVKFRFVLGRHPLAAALDLAAAFGFWQSPGWHDVSAVVLAGLSVAYDDGMDTAP